MIALLVALAVTVPLKFLVTPVAWQYPVIDRPVAEFLSRHGLQPRVEKRAGGPVIHATSGDCRLLVLEMEPRGTNLDRVESAGRAAGFPVVFVFEGVMYREPPVRRTLLKYYWVRLQQRFGVNASLNPVLAVAAAASCELDKLPWQELAS